jgi:hypothetical protein
MQEIRVLDVNQQTLAMFGAPSKEILLSRLGDVFRDDMRIHFAEQLVDLWHEKLWQQREVINYALDGRPVDVFMQWSVFPGREADWDQVLVSLTDITARKKAEAYVEFLGKHDVLTKLYNRAYYEDELARLGRKGPWPVSVIAVDLNGLKAVNDQFGHGDGDALLRRTGEVLKKPWANRHALRAPAATSSWCCFPDATSGVLRPWWSRSRKWSSSTTSSIPARGCHSRSGRPPACRRPPDRCRENCGQTDVRRQARHYEALGNERATQND